MNVSTENNYVYKTDRAELTWKIEAVAQNPSHLCSSSVVAAGRFSSLPPGLFVLLSTLWLLCIAEIYVPCQGLKRIFVEKRTGVLNPKNRCYDPASKRWPFAQNRSNKSLMFNDQTCYVLASSPLPAAAFSQLTFNPPQNSRPSLRGKWNDDHSI